MENRVLIQIEEFIKNNDVESASSLIIASEAEYKRNADFWNLKGVLCFHVGDINGAISCFSHSVQLNVNHDNAIANLEFAKLQLSDVTIEDITLTNDQGFVKDFVDSIDAVISKVETCIQSVLVDDLSGSIPILKNVHDVIEMYGGKIERLKRVVQSRYMSNVFENTLRCVDDCLNTQNMNTKDNLILLLEFTLYPLLKELREEIYFFGLIYPNVDKMDNYYMNEFALANANQYAKRSIQTGEYKYAVSILVTAYNKLEYTRQCVESILKYTQDIDFELILVNDGSSDGTHEYFESVPYKNKKVISFHKNTGAMLAYFIGVRAVEGRVLAAVSNDVIVTEGWLQNLLICLESDKTIGMVVPTTNASSNNQTIPVPYTRIEDMQAFASYNNRSDTGKWYERERLCPFLHVVPMHIFGKGLCHDRLFFYGEFCDDDISLQLRLNGYKLILAKDTFCHHFGSISLGEAQRNSNSIQISRELFKLKNKIDAWHDLHQHTAQLVSNIDFSVDKSIRILCIDPGFGFLPYWIKNQYKENGNENVTIHIFSAEKQFSGKLFENYSTAENLSNLKSIYNGQKFDFILFCKYFEEYDIEEFLLTDIRGMLSEKGELRFLVSNFYSANNIAQLLSLQDNLFGDKVFRKFASYVAVEKLLLGAGFNSINMLGITSPNSHDVIDSVKEMASYLNVKLSSAHDILYRSDLLLFIAEARKDGI